LASFESKVNQKWRAHYTLGVLNGFTMYDQRHD
jgi:hypothetical protein